MKTSTAMVHQPGAEPLTPWERQAVDTDDSWEAFKKFRDSKPPRRLSQQRGVATEKLYRWFRDHCWDSRVLAYDAHVERILLEERDAILRQGARERTADLLATCNAAQEYIQLELDKHLALAKEGTFPLSKIAELTKMLDVVVKNTRLLQGESTENVDHQVDLSGLSMDELKMFKQLTEKTKPIPVQLKVIK